MHEARRHGATVEPAGDQETLDIIAPGHTYESVTQKISSLVLNNQLSRPWLLALALFFAIASVGMLAITLTLLFGVGLWGNNQPNGWAFAIVNFVWWIGIGHAGTLISAILLLVHQNWRMAEI